MKWFVSSIFVVGTCLGQSADVAADELVLDYRDTNFRSGQAFYSAPVRQRIESALSMAPDPIRNSLGEKFVVLGDAPLPTPKNEGHGVLYLLSTRGPIAAEPFPEGIKQYLAVLEDNQLRGIYPLPEDAAYGRLVGVVKLTDRTSHGALLESSFFNMGQSVTTVDLVQLNSSGAVVTQSFKNAYYDGCDNPVGVKERTAATITQNRRGALRSETFTLPCR